MEGDRPRQTVTRLALVQFGGDRAAQSGIVEPAQREQRALDPPNLAQRRSEAVLLAVGGQLLEDQRGLDGSVTDRANVTFNFRPVAEDQVPVEPVTEQWLKPGISAPWLARGRAACMEGVSEYGSKRGG